MLTKLEQAQKEWGGAHNAIDHWLEERQQLLVDYCKLGGLPPFERADRRLPDKVQIQNFCQLLVDYVSTGHFEVYNQVVSQCEKHGGDSLQLAKNLYLQISDTTDAALNFNDKYAEISEEDLLGQFDQDMSQLGQAIETRFALEDQLLQTLSHYHAEVPATSEN